MKSKEDKNKIVVGIDVSKADMVVRCSWEANVKRFANTKSGIRKLTRLISAITIYAALNVRFNTLLKVMYQEPQVNPVAS